MEPKKYTLSELATITHANLIGDSDHLITNVEALDSATSEDASFLANPKYRSALKTTKAGVICIDRQTPIEPGKNFLVSDDPSLTFQIIVKILLLTDENKSGFTGIHPTACVHPSATLGQHVQIGPFAVIDQHTVIGDHTVIASFVYVGPGVHLGTYCHLHPHAVVRERCQLGHRVILQPGAVIGSCGFGYSTDAKGRHTKLEQLGTVIIEDDVEIGANTTIDRARFKATTIRRGTKIDNLVQIGHNVTLGQDNIIVSQSGIAGSAKTGKNVVLGGQAGVVGHLEIADGVMIATRGGVSKSIDKPGKYGGGPVMSLSDYNRQQVHLRKIADYVKQIEQLEERLSKLEQQRQLQNS